MTPITSDEQALLANLRSGVIYRPKRWSGDTHDDLGGSIDEPATHELMQEAAHAIERLAKTGPAVETPWQAYALHLEWCGECAVEPCRCKEGDELRTAALEARG